MTQPVPRQVFTRTRETYNSAGQLIQTEVETVEAEEHWEVHLPNEIRSALDEVRAIRDGNVALTFSTLDQVQILAEAIVKIGRVVTHDYRDNV